MSQWNEMIEGCRQHNGRSQEALYRHCYADMLKVCLHYARDIDEAGALYNEAMLKVFSSLHQYSGEHELMAWIRRIVVNTCIDHYRKEARFGYQSIETVQDPGITVNPEVYRSLSTHDVMKLLHELPRNTALVFNLHVLEGYKHEEIGQLLGIAAGTCKWHLNEARRLLKIKLDSLLKKEMYSNAI